MEATVTRWLGASREGMGRYKREISAVIAREKRGRYGGLDGASIRCAVTVLPGP